jgi:elongation factor Ts
MANFSAADVKKLRDLTGAGMMDCKNALTEADGNLDKAVEILRVKGAAKAAKRGAEREAASGLVAAAEGAMIELNSETDFVAKNEQFQQLATDIVAHAAATKPADAAALLGETLADGKTVEENISSLAAVIGEKLQLGRVAVFDGQVASYMHRRASDLPPAVGVLVEYEGDNLDAARGAAMQIAAMRPAYVTRDEVPEDIVAKEREIAEAKALDEGKPEQALPKIVEGRVNAYFKEVVLLEQPSVTDQKKSVKAVLDEAGVSVSRFARFEVGAGRS